MSDKTGIEWTDATWNPVTGCDEVSPGCDRCYAKTFAERWRGTPGHYFENGFDVQLRPDKLTLPFSWRKGKKVFVNSMSDLFHKDVPDSYITSVFAVMALTPQHTYQILTKRHGRMRSLLNEPEFWYRVGREARHRGYHNDRAANYLGGGQNIYDTAEWEQRRHLDNVWLGVSVEDQKRADLRIPALRQTPADVRFLSCEPLLGPLNTLDLDGIGWVIVGGESGHGARPMHPQWARTIREQCERAAVPFHFKQRGQWTWSDPGPGSTEPHKYVSLADGRTAGEEVALADGGEWQGVWRTSKHAAGRELDGREWSEYPAVSA